MVAAPPSFQIYKQQKVYRCCVVGPFTKGPTDDVLARNRTTGSRARHGLFKGAQWSKYCAKKFISDGVKIFFCQAISTTPFRSVNSAYSFWKDSGLKPLASVGKQHTVSFRCIFFLINYLFLLHKLQPSTGLQFYGKAPILLFKQRFLIYQRNN